MFFDNMLAQPETPQMSHRAPATPSRQPASTLTADQVIPRYIATPQPHNQLAEITLNAAAAQQQFQQAQQVQPQQQQQELQRPGANRQSQWFRGGPPSAGPPRSAPNQRPGAVPTPGTPVSGFRPVGSEQAPSPVSNVSVPPLVESPMTPQQIAELQRRSQRQIEKGLEEMILRSPDVHLLSPVDVKFVNGVATINGLVTNNECKVKAGEILLAVPGVRQVQNLLATIEDEDKQ